jgi:hypothetical protein
MPAVSGLAHATQSLTAAVANPPSIGPGQVGPAQLPATFTVSRCVNPTVRRLSPVDGASGFFRGLRHGEFGLSVQRRLRGSEDEV